MRALQKTHEAALVADGFPPWYANSWSFGWLYVLCAGLAAICLSGFAVATWFGLDGSAGHALVSASAALSLPGLAAVCRLPTLCEARWHRAHPGSPYAVEATLLSAMSDLENLHTYRLAALDELVGRLTVDEVDELKRLCPDPSRHACYPVYYRELDWDVATQRFDQRLRALLSRPA